MSRSLFRNAALIAAGALFACLALVGSAALAGTGVGDVFNLGQGNTVDATSTLSGSVDTNPQLNVINNGNGAAIRVLSMDGRGVFGTHGSATGTLPGVAGSTDSTDPRAIGVQGSLPPNADPSAVAVKGLGVSGIGVLGQHSATTGTSPGVEGSTASTDPTAAAIVAENIGGGPALDLGVKDGSVPPLTVNSSTKVSGLNADLLDGLDSTALPYWSLGGNGNTSPDVNSLGTTDGAGLAVQPQGGSLLGIGTTSPVGILDARAPTGALRSTLDQQQPTSATALSCGSPAWQSFTAGRSGLLSTLVVYGIIAHNPTTLSIYRGQGTSGELLSTQNINVPGGQATISISPAVRIYAGQRYTWAIALGSNPSGSFNGADGDVYGGGKSNCPFPADYFFSTYVKSIVGSHPALFVSTNGLVGVGTTTPGAALTVQGNLQVTGNISKGSGSFKIDDPLDPAHRFLEHSFVESPDMKDVYDGIVRTDTHGFAVVELPRYFQVLNRTFRYQLTPIGQFAQAIVAKEIAHNRFTIRTDKPQVKVSWQVTGVRHDRYANAHRIPTEARKPPSEQGRYLHPELYGKAKALSIFAAAKGG